MREPDVGLAGSDCLSSIARCLSPSRKRESETGGTGNWEKSGVRKAGGEARDKVFHLQRHRQRDCHRFDEFQVPQSFTDDTAQLLT